MSPRDAVRRMLPPVLAAAAFACSASPALAAPGPGVCPGPVIVGCVPGPLPTGLPGPQPSPTPTAAPVPGPAPAPAPVGIPIDFGFTALAQKVFAGGAWFTPQLYPMLSASVGGDANWFQELYRRMENIGALLLLLFLVAGVITALIERNPMLMLKVPFLYLPLAIGATVLAIQLTQTLMAVVDGFTLYMLQGLGDDLSGLLTHLGAVLAAAAAGTALSGQGLAVFAIVVSALVFGLIGIMLELLARTAAIYVCLAFLPVTVACLLWPKLAHLPRLLAEILVGLVLLKWVVAVVLVLGAKAFAANPFTMGPQGDPGFVSIVMGAAMVLIAVTSPLALVKVIPWVEGRVVGSWSGRVRATAAAATRIHPAFYQAALGRGAAERLRLPVKSGSGQPGVMVLPAGSRVFVRSPRPAPDKRKRA